MKKVTKKALSLAVTTMLLMNTFTTIAFADPGHDHGNGHAHGIECDKEQFANGHDNRDHSKQIGEQEPEDLQEEILIEVMDEQIENQQEEENELAEMIEEETQQEETEEEEAAEEESEEAAEEESQQEEEIQQEEIAEEETSEEEAEAVEEESEEEISEQIEEIEEIEEAEEVEEIEEDEEAEEETLWESYTLYNYISVNNGKTYISLNTQENGITTPKTAAEFHRENNNKKYNLEGYEYEIADYDLTELVYTENGISYVEKSVAAKGQPYFTARLDRVEAVAQARFRASNCVSGIESFTSIEDGTITFHRNWYLTLVRPMEADQKLLTGIQMPNGKYYGIDYTDTFKAIDSRTIAFNTKLNKDQYEIEDYDFSELSLNYEGNTYEYRPDGPVAGDGNGFHYYTVKFQKLDKLAKSTYGGGYLKEGWPAWPLVNVKAADPDGFPYAAGYYHRDYTVTLHVGDAPAAVIEEEPVIEEPAVEEPEVIEEPVPVEAIIPAAAEEIIAIAEVIEGEVTQDEEIVEEVTQDEEVVEEEVAQDEETVEEEAAQDEEIVEEEVAQDEEIVEEEVAQDEEIVEEIAQDEEVVEEVAQGEEIVEEIIPAAIEEIIAIAAAAPVEEESAQAEEIVEEVAQDEEVVEEPAQIEEIVEEVAQDEEVVEEVAQDEEVVEEVAQDEEIVEEAIEEIEEEIQAEEPVVEEIVAMAETVEQKSATPAKIRKNTPATVETINNEATTHQVETLIEEESAQIEEIVEDNAAPMAAIAIEAVEEEIADEAAPMAAFEAVTVAQNEPAQAAVAEAPAEEPTFVAVATMQVSDFVEIEEAEVPFAANGTWSLASLIFMGMSVILGVATLATTAASRKAKFLATAIAAASAAIFLAFSTLGGAMVTVDGGTFGIIVLNICEAVLASVATNTAK